MAKNKVLLPLFILLLSIITKGNAQKKDHFPKNEFRGVWIATVVNIDWPKKITILLKSKKRIIYKFRYVSKTKLQCCYRSNSKCW